MTTIKEFIDRWEKRPNNEWVDHPGFNGLYLRKGAILIRINDKAWWCEPCLTIASVEAENPGQGAFTRLIEKLKKEYNFAIYVENAHEKRFQEKLLKLGFTQVNFDHGPNFIINYKAMERMVNGNTKN